MLCDNNQNDQFIYDTHQGYILLLIGLFQINSLDIELEFVFDNENP